MKTPGFSSSRSPKPPRPHTTRPSLGMAVLLGVLHVGPLTGGTIPGGIGPAQAQSAFETPSGYYEDARRRVAEGDPPGALIQLKNALQLDDSHTPSMMLMGEILLEEGSASQASLVLEEALLLGADQSATTRLLIEAYLQSKNYSAILRELPYEEAPEGLRAELLAANAQAYLGQGRNNEASTLIQRCRAIDPDNLRAAQASVTLYLRRQQIAEAAEAARFLTTAAPDDTRSWSAWGSVQQLRGNSDAALESYRRALELLPANVDARLALITILVQLRRFDDADADIAYLRDNFPEEPRAAYYQGLLASYRGDSETEITALSNAVNLIDAFEPERINSDLQMLMIGALAHIGLGSFELAYEYLERFLSINPDNPAAQRLSALVLISLDESDRALQTLLKLNARYPDDEQTILLLASAYGEEGDYRRATELLSRLDNAGSGTRDSDVQLGISQFNAGMLPESVDTLEAVAGLQPENSAIRMPLAMAYMRMERWEEARALLETAVGAEPEDPNLRNLLTLALLNLGDSDAAEAMMRELAAERPDFLPARINLAKLAINRGDLASASKTLQKLGEDYPDEARVIFEKALLAVAEGDDDSEALRLAERAVMLDPRNNDYLRLLVDRYFAADMESEALETAERASTASDDPFDGSLLFAEALIASDKRRQAALVYTQMARKTGFEFDRLMQIADRQSAIGFHASALATIGTALTADGMFRPARRALIIETLAAGDPEGALELSLAYRQDFAGEDFGALMQGEALLALNRAEAAIDAFRSAASLGAADEGCLGQYRAYRQMGRLEDAERVLRKRIDAQEEDAEPRNPVLVAAHSDALIALGAYETAERVLTTILAAQPDSWAHWNNRAYVRLQLNHPESESDAREALRLAPDIAAVNDTLGWILTRKGQPRDALPYLREATTRNADDPAMRYHLGATLAALGRQREAEKELYFALEAEVQWDGKSEAQALLSELQSGGESAGRSGGESAGKSASKSGGESKG